MKITKTVTTEKELNVPTDITLQEDYQCANIGSINCKIQCSECVLDPRHIVDFLNHVRDNDKSE